MKKLFYFLLIAGIALVSTDLHAQYTITGHTATTYADTFCNPPTISIQSSGHTTGLMVRTYYGDGRNDLNSLVSTSGGGSASYSHMYLSPGMYTVKQVLILGSTAIDSVIWSYDHKYCNTFRLNAYYDANSNCVFDEGSEHSILYPMTIAVDRNGIRIDTVITTSGLGYEVNGYPGDVYTFTIIHSAAGLVLTCPASGVVSDTISTTVNNYIKKYFAFECSGTTGYDAAILASARAGRHAFTSNLLVSNQYCNTTGITVTMNMSPKYNYQHATPTPTSVVGNTFTWIFPGVSLLTPENIFVYGEVPSSWLVPGDTVHSSYSVTPIAGDADPSNNTVVLVDTVLGSFDPNDKAVTPAGYLTPGAGTKLTYTLRFENTGNDTAFNIHLLDTLSANLDVKSLEVLGSSAAMDLNIQKVGTQNIVKFDFPNINLLDSSHHGLCDGMVIFSIKTKDGLPNGTIISNRAGIYFDYNDVVMTNTVTKIVGTPTGIEDMTNVPTAEVTLFPNPANDELSLQISSGNFSTVSVINTIGKEVMKQNISSANTKLNVKALPSGSYYISVKGNSGVKVLRFQKM